MNLCYIFTGIAVIATIIFLVVRTTVGGPLGTSTKALASFAFILLALVGANKTGMNTYSMFILLGLVCGLIGDILLDNKVVYKEHSNTYLNAGMASFGLGHIFYFVAASYLAINMGKSGVILLLSLGVSIISTAIIMSSAKPLKLDFGKFFYQSLAYTCILTFMTAYSICLAGYNSSLWTLAAGLGLFLLSDLVLSTQYFGGKQDNKVLIWINHLLYYAAQILIAISLFLV